MATVPAKPTPTPPPETLEARFNRLAEEWDNATAHLSSMSEASRHPAYQQIICMGEGVVPLLLRDLGATHRHWFIALKEITKANPISSADAGKIPRMVDAWLGWAKDKGYQW
jgi:hypothetical protein